MLRNAHSVFCGKIWRTARYIHASAIPELPVTDAQRQTIYALSTPPGKGGIGIVRVSGPRASDVREAIVHTRRATIRTAMLERCHVRHPETGEHIDDGMAVFFHGPKSFTTEDVLELHVHSGKAIIAAVLSALSQLPFCRPAEPGEFTRRAFKGGRLDLTQVEGLKDLINAETEVQRRLALASAEGSTRVQFENLRKDVIHCLAMVEALIDFGDTDDLEHGVFEGAQQEVLSLCHTIQGHLQDNRRGEILRSGIRLAIFGAPNAGKSSLLNFLAQREAAIVTPVPGTTRDILELSLDVAGLPIIVADTAGLRPTDDYVESIGIDRATKRVQSADVTLCVLSLPEVLQNGTIVIPEALRSVISDSTLFLLNKFDLVDPLAVASAVKDFHQLYPSWTASLETNYGMNDFLSGLTSNIKNRFDFLDSGLETDGLPLITHPRHRVHLESALQFLHAFSQYGPDDIVLGAEELRYAAQALGKICGVIDTEDILDAVFRDFCIGK